jgi:hypothetical protein
VNKKACTAQAFIYLLVGSMVRGGFFASWLVCIIYYLLFIIIFLTLINSFLHHRILRRDQGKKAKKKKRKNKKRSATKREIRTSEKEKWRNNFPSNSSRDSTELAFLFFFLAGPQARPHPTGSTDSTWWYSTIDPLRHWRLSPSGTALSWPAGRSGYHITPTCKLTSSKQQAGSSRKKSGN